MRHILWSCIFLLLSLTPALAQQEMRSATKGSSTPLPITGTSIDSNHNGLDVNVVGGTISGSGGTQYDEDTAHVSGDKLTMAGVVQKTADAALAADGDNTALQVDSNGYLKVNIKAGAGSGGTAMTDDAAFTPATTSITPAGFLFDDVSPDSVNEGDGGVGRMSANRNIYTTIRDAAGNERGVNINASNELLTNANTELPAAAALADDTSNPTVPGVGSFNMCWDGTNWDRCAKGTGGNGAVDANTQRVTLANDSTGVLASVGTIGTSVTPGTSAAHLGKAEDAAHTTGDTGVMLLGVRHDTATTGLGVDGDYAALGLSSGGRLWTSSTIDAALPAGSNVIGALTANQSVNVAQMNGVTVTMGAGATGTGVQRVNPVSSSATGAAPPASASFIGGLGSGATGGFLIGPAVADTFVNVNVSTATTTLLITGVSGRHVRISAMNLLTAAANNVALISGTGATCGTGTTGMNGGTTAGSGWNFPANGGIAQGSGVGTINQTNATGDSVCIVTSAATQLSGRLAYAIY